MLGERGHFFVELRLIVVHSLWTLTALPVFTVRVQVRARQRMATVRYAYAGLPRLVLVTKRCLSTH